jgi:hypothetical protein
MVLQYQNKLWNIVLYMVPLSRAAAGRQLHRVMIICPRLLNSRRAHWVAVLNASGVIGGVQGKSRQTTSFVLPRTRVFGSREPITSISAVIVETGCDDHIPEHAIHHCQRSVVFIVSVEGYWR